MIRQFVKNVATGVALVFAFPWALVAGFGRFDGLFGLSAQACSTVPGIVGDYLRIAFYRLTLEECSLNSRVSFGSFFAHSNARVGQGVYIGSYCVLGSCRIGDRTQIASQVQVLSGRRQHPRDASGQIGSATEGEFQTIDIGADCWIGASAVVMASVGAGSTVGAGAVVVSPVDAGVVAVGNPARMIKGASITPAASYQA
jgi:acetyltransferase-like isoleucine patch superfamily enzyme